MAQDWMTTGELARELGLSEATITRQCYERENPSDPVPPGRIPAVRFGHQWRILRSYLKTKKELARHQADVTTIRHVRRQLRRGQPMVDHFGS